MTEQTCNPYLASRREWDERYGDLISRAKNWRIMALLCGLIALVAVIDNIAIRTQSHMAPPFVVAVDKLNHVIASGFADGSSASSSDLQQSAIVDWIEKLRTLTTDGVAEQKNIERVYARIANGSPAQASVNDFYSKEDPFKRAQKETVSADVHSVLRVSDRTFEVEWTETTRDLYGVIKATDRYKGSFVIGINPPQDEAGLRSNPLGIYITQASWAKSL